MPTHVPNQYGTVGPNAAYGAAITMDRSFMGEDRDKYWGGIPRAYREKYGDENSLFVNSSYTPRSTANTRYNDGVEAGQDLISKFENGELSLEEGETIKLIGHSQGAAYAAGIVSVLAKHEKYGGLLEFVDYLSPHQPADFNHPSEVLGRQFSTKGDKVSSVGWIPYKFGKSYYKKIKGAQWGIERDQYKGGFGGHFVDTWVNDMISYWRSLGIPVTVHD